MQKRQAGVAAAVGRKIHGAIAGVPAGRGEGYRRRLKARRREWEV